MNLDEHLRETIREVVREELETHEQAREREWRWLTSRQAGELLGISPAAVAARVRRGTLVGRTYRGRLYVDRLILDAELLAE